MLPQEALHYRLRSLLNLAEDVELVREFVAKFRQQAAARDTYHGFLRLTPLKEDNLVLIVNKQRKTNYLSFRKLTYQ